jgi:hypothetical protein
MNKMHSIQLNMITSGIVISESKPIIAKNNLLVAKRKILLHCFFLIFMVRK